MRIYVYELRLRPPGIGCQPDDGLLETGEFARREAYEEFGGHPCWGWAAYGRELSDREVESYELAPVTLVTEVAEESDVYDWAKTYEFGAYKEVYIGGGLDGVD